jgi:glutaredoxin
MSKKVQTSTSSVLGNRGVLAGIIIILVIIAMVAIFFATANTGGVAAVPPEECGAAVISYVNTNLAAANTTATLVSVTEKNGMYQIAGQYQARNISLYATKDCTLMFSSSYNLKATPTPTSSPKPTTSPTPIPEPVKSARPSTELFVMSFCPYGVQAENAMDPVVGLLGTKTDITVRYIAQVQGTTVDSVKSLHGLTEAKEDLRQLCIAKYYPQELWPYLMDFNKNCVAIRQNETLLDACETNITRTLGIDNQKIETCASGSEGLDLLRADEVITGNYKVTGSPTLIINGQRYSGQRTAEAFKQAICARFETPPAECSVNLSAQTATASSGSC